MLIGSAAANVLNGLAGNDLLNGGAGADTFIGGAGADTFEFTAFGDIPSGALHDTIVDFHHLEDVINLSALDADSKTDGNQAFTFIGNAAFTGHAGELNFVANGTGPTVMGDTNGDARADFSVELIGISALQSTDFIL